MEAYASFPSRLRLSITLVIVLMVISSPLVVLFSSDSTQALAYTSVKDTSRSNVTLPTSVENSNSKTPSTSMSTSVSPGSPSIQAPLQIPRTLQSTDLVNSLGFYEVTFITPTTGAIDKIRMDFPAGTGVGAAGIIERVGIGGGTLLKSGSSITHDVTTPVSIPAGTFIRLEMFGIKNPINPSTTFTAMITTRDSGGNLIDGPSQTNVYTIKKIVSSDLADGSVTPTKPAESFMRDVSVLDNPAGNAIGWDPDGIETSFEISEPEILSFGTFISVEVRAGDNVNRNCDTVNFSLSLQTFIMTCESPPPANAVLHYVVQNLPTHLIE